MSASMSRTVNVIDTYALEQAPVKFAGVLENIDDPSSPTPFVLGAPRPELRIFIEFRDPDGRLIRKAGERESLSTSDPVEPPEANDNDIYFENSVDDPLITKTGDWLYRPRAEVGTVDAEGSFAAHTVVVPRRWRKFRVVR